MNLSSLLPKSSTKSVQKIYIEPADSTPESDNNITAIEPVNQAVEAKDEKPSMSPVKIPSITIPNQPKDISKAYTSTSDDLFTEDYSEPNVAPTQPRHKSVQLPFNKQFNLDVIIDGAMGLPLTTTATRLHVKLHMPTREIVTDISPYEYCDLSSEYSCPTFKFRFQWKGKTLHPTMTIVVYIETLESLSLLPRTVGLAALRLCIDNVGLQPLSEVLYDDRPSCYFNTGQFAVPILYGTLSELDDLPYISEAKMQEHLPHIDGAYLRIGLLAARPGDQVIDKPFPTTFTRESSVLSSMRADMYVKTAQDVLGLYSNSVASVLWKTYLSTQVAQQSNKGAPTGTLASLLGSSNTNSVYNTTALSISPSILGKFVEHGETLSEQDKLEAIKELSKFMIRSFEHETSHVVSQPTLLSAHTSMHTSIHTSMHSTHSVGGMSAPSPSHTPLRPLINSQYLVEYMDGSGTLVALDMLYNMPERKMLIEAAEKAASVAAMKSGFSKGWEDKINYFKTVFRYLPGKIIDNLSTSSSSYKEEVENALRMQSVHESSMTDGELIFDDASVKPFLSSSELSPAYTDEYSSTAGMKLGAYSCVLIVVTAVDVLTGHGGEHKGGNDEFLPLPAVSLSPMNSRASLLHSKDSSSRSIGSNSGFSPTPRNLSTDAATKKLKGLLGIYVGHNDAKATWWTLVPLFRTLPPHLLHTINTSKPVLTKVSSKQLGRSPASALFRALSPSNLLPQKTNGVNKTAENSVSVTKGHMQPEMTKDVRTFDVNGSTLHNAPSTSTAAMDASVSTVDLTRSLSLNCNMNLKVDINFPKEQTSVKSPKSPPTSPISGNVYDKLLNSTPPVSFKFPLFINDGTHQMPLFEGLPCEEMIFSPNPMQWLVNQLNKQMQVQPAHSQTGGSSLTRFFAPLLSLFMSQDTFGNNGGPGQKKSKKKKKKAEEIKLSHGSCAIVRLANPRIKKLAPASIVDHRDKYIDRFLLDFILRLFAQAYNPNQVIVRSPSSSSLLPSPTAQTPPPSIATQHSQSQKNSSTIEMLSNIVTTSGLSSHVGQITVTYYLVHFSHYARVLSNNTLDNTKYRTLKNLFVFHNNHTLFSTLNTSTPGSSSPGKYANSKHNKDKRILSVLMSKEGLEAKELIAQINQKFYQTISG